MQTTRRWRKSAGTLAALLAGLGLTLAGCPSDPTVVEGPVGPQGPTGPTGPQGPAGADGADGADGATGATGPAGADGAQGPAGADGAAGAQGATGPAGPTGPQGPVGEDGQLRVYGNGSDGARTITSNTNISTETISHQYTDLTINAGVTLTVPSGIVIRCTGTFTNNGTLVVGFGARGGLPAGPLAIPEIGVAASAPTTGTNNTLPNGPSIGLQGLGNASPFLARWNIDPGFFGGSGGAATGDGAGSRGGGTVVILAETAINNSATGVINANGEGDLGGGGGGGIVVLASRTAVTNAGQINARGGDGADAADLSGSFRAASGGGAGGIIRILAPSITNSGTTSVLAGANGGVPGAPIATFSGTNVFAGGGGGACFDQGGNSGSSTFVAGAPPNGDITLTAPTVAPANGFFEATTVDPTALF